MPFLRHLQAVPERQAPTPDDAENRQAEVARVEKLDSLGRVCGEIAHDFNNLLQVIANAVEVLHRRQGGADPDAQKLVELVKRNILSGTHLTQALLAFSATHPLTPAETDVNGLVRSVGDQLQRFVDPQVSVRVTPGATMAALNVDADRLSRALMDLAANACEAMPRGGQLTIETRDLHGVPKHELPPVLRPGDYLAITVGDEGMGMSDDVLARAGEPYFTTKGNVPRKGLGLARSWGFARQSGGHLQIRSRPGRGTAVTLFLPVPRSDAPSSPTGGMAEAGDDRLAGLRVALVEDEMLVAMLIRDLLDELGCEVVAAASDAQGALSVIERPDVQLALLDVNLQGSPAYGLAEKLQQRGVPFAFVSGGGHQDRRWDRVPMVQKPVDLQRMKQALLQALSGASH